MVESTTTANSVSTGKLCAIPFVLRYKACDTRHAMQGMRYKVWHTKYY